MLRRRDQRWRLGLLALCVVGATATVEVQRRSAPATRAFTSAQADAGRLSYQTYCVRCHPLERNAHSMMPSLVGEEFLRQWRDRTTADLFQYLQKTMPPASPGDAGFEVDLGIIAYLLQANGAAAGPVPLTTTTTVRIGDLANGRTHP